MFVPDSLKRRRLAGLTLLLIFTALVIQPGPAQAAPRLPRQDVLDVRGYGLAPMISPDDAPGVGVVGSESCTITGSPTADIDISCDSAIAPDNELAIAVNPEDPDHLLAGSNDYQLNFVGNTAVVRIPTGFFVSFDGGATWTEGQIPLGNSALGAGDPSPVFNAKFDTAHMASLGFVCGQGSPVCTRGNLTVSTSRDGGLTWERPVTVVKGQGADTSAKQYFNDKEWLTADNHPSSPYYGRLYLVWVEFLTEKGAYNESPVLLSYSDDAGQSWSKATVISGRSEEFCEAQDDLQDIAAGEDPFECDQDQFAYPVVAPDGTFYVHFHNEQNASAWESAAEYESQIMVVKSTDGGQSWSDPVHVVQMEDGYGDDPDYPLNVSGRTTLTGHQFRVNSAGNIAVGPAGQLYIVYADNAAGSNINDPDAEAVTNTNIYLAYSTDGGSTWLGGDTGQTDLASRIIVAGALEEEKDQWFPWADVDPTTGDLKVLYMDGAADRDRYAIEIATWSVTTLDREIVSQADSYPDESIWFRARVEGCQNCATFIGDYNGLAIDSLGRAHGTWTDMRRPITAAPALHTQDAFYARQGLDSTSYMGTSALEASQPHLLYIPTVAH